MLLAASFVLRHLGPPRAWVEDRPQEALDCPDDSPSHEPHSCWSSIRSSRFLPTTIIGSDISIPGRLPRRQPCAGDRSRCFNRAYGRNASLISVHSTTTLSMSSYRSKVTSREPCVRSCERHQPMQSRQVLIFERRQSPQRRRSVHFRVCALEPRSRTREAARRHDRSELSGT